MANTGTNAAANTNAPAAESAETKAQAAKGTEAAPSNILDDVCVVEAKSEAPVILERPDADTVKEVELQPGQNYIFAFDKGEVTDWIQDGNDLKICFDCGAILVLKNYTSVVTGSDAATFAFSDAIPQGVLANLVKIETAEQVAQEEKEALLQKQAAEKDHAKVDDVAAKMANIKPAAGDMDASKLAQIEPAAGETGGGAAGRGGYGFNSSYETTPVGPLNAVGPIDPTALRYNARFPEPDVLITAEEDDAPALTAPGNAIDETNLAGGPIVVGGTIVADFGGDGPGTIGPNGDFLAGGSLAGGDLQSNGVHVDVTQTVDGYVGMAGGVTVFTLTIDPATGDYTFTQFEQLDHADGSDPNDVIDLIFGVVATDDDGDKTSTSLTITVADDAPLASAPMVENIDEADLSGGPIVVNDNLFVNFGQDVPGTVDPNGTATVSGDVAGGVLKSDGVDVIITPTANGYEGKAGATPVFTITIDNTGAYTFTLFQPLDHSDPGDVISLNFGVTITDYDLDSVTTDITVNIIDDEPHIVNPGNPVVGKGLENIDETNLGPIVVGGAVPIDFGSDGPGAFGATGTFTAGGSLPGGDLKSHGVDVDVNLVGNVYEGKAGGVTVFTLLVNTDGSYVFTQFEQLDHADGSNPNDVISLVFGVDVTDDDGDSDTGIITINVADDAPTIDGDGTKIINEADLSPAVVHGNLVEDFGEDGQGNIHTTDTFNATGDIAGGLLKSDGHDVTVTSTANGYTGTANGATVFTLTIDPVTGAYTFTLLGALDHTPGGSQILLTFGTEIVDYDGDTDKADIVIKVKDDVPHIDDNNPKIGNGLEVVDETNLGPIVRDGAISFDFGGDGPGAFGANGTSSSSVALTSGGVPVTITPSGTGYTGTANGTTIFTMTINADGTYKFTLFGVLDHPVDGLTAAAHDDIITLNFGVSVSDADGGSDTGNIVVRVHDDGPTAHDDFNTLNDVTHTATGNVITGLNGGPGAADILSQDDDNTVTQISFNGNTVNVPTSGSVDLTGDFGTLTIAADGTYTYHQFTGIEPVHFNETLIFPTLGEGVAISGAALNNVGIKDGVLTVPSDSTGTITFDGGITAYNDTLGAYTVGPDGTIHAVQMLFANGHNTTDGSSYAFNVGGGDTAGFFIIANGDVANGGYPGIDFSTGQLSFIYDYGLPTERTAKVTDSSAHLSLVYTSDSNVDTVLQGPTYHSTERGDSAAINPDGQVHVISGLTQAGDDTHLRIGFEDLPNLGDRDYGDVVFNLTLNINKGVCGTDEFLYTLQDGDGDTSQATLTLICDDYKPILVQPEKVVVDETDLHPTTSVSDSIQANFGNDGPGTFDGTGTFAGGPFTSHGQPVSVNYDPATHTYTGTSNGNTIFTLVVQTNGNYTFTLLGVLDHPNPADPNDGVDMNFGIKAIDADGDVATGNITVRVLDDGPKAFDDFNTAHSKAPVGGNVLTNDLSGQDGLGAVTKISFNGTTLNIAAGSSADIDGQYGHLHISSNGEYEYTSFGTGTGTDKFEYTMKDYDGDTSVAKLKITSDYCPEISVKLKVNDNVDDICLKEDHSAFIPVVASIVDGDGNEQLTLTLNGVGTGWNFSGTGWTATGVAGQYQITLPVGTQSYNGGFTLTPPHDSDVDLTGLTVTAHATDPDTAGANATDSFNVNVDAVVDTPVLTVPTTLGAFGWYYSHQGYNVALNIASNVTDTDGSEVVTKIVIDLSQPFTNPVSPFYTLDDMGIGLNKGTEVSPGVWEIPVNAGNTATALNGLALVVPNNMDYGVIHQQYVGWHDVNITVKSYVSEANLSGNECDYTDNDTCIVKNICLTFYITPLVMDLNGDGIHLVSQEAGILFDMNNDGIADQTSWVDTHDGLLAIDLNLDGIINNQTELFGNSDTAATGFQDLAQYDLNADGIINSDDVVFSKLTVWQDVNSDGVSQSGELHSLSDLGIASINLNATETDYMIGDSRVSHESTFTYADGHTGAIVDAWFNVKDGESDSSVAPMVEPVNNPSVVAAAAIIAPTPAAPAPVTQGHVYYVATTGNDQNAGGINDPFATFEKAFHTMQAGDTLYIRGGDYHGLDNVQASNGYNNTYEYPSGTSWENATTVAAYPGETVKVWGLGVGHDTKYMIFDGLHIEGGVWIGNDAGYIRVINSEVRGDLQGDDDYGVMVSANGSSVGHNEFINLDVHGFGFSHMLDADYGQPYLGRNMHGMYLSVPNNLIENSRIHDNTGFGIHLYDGDNDNTIVRDNLIYDNGAGMDGTSFGVYLANGDNIMVYGNEIYGNSGGLAVSSTATNAKVFDNVIHDNDRLPGYEYSGVTAGDANGLLLQDNVIYNQKAGALAISANSIAIDNVFTASPVTSNTDSATGTHTPSGSVDNNPPPSNVVTEPTNSLPVINTLPVVDTPPVVVVAASKPDAAPAAATHGQVYYMATWGSDSDSGGINDPFASFEKAFNTMHGGDTLYIRGGDYHGLDNVQASNGYNNTYEYPSGTSWENATTVAAYPGETVKVWGLGVGHDTKYMIFDGFHIEGGVWIGQDAGYIRVINSEVKGDLQGNDDFGVVVSANGSSVGHNEFINLDIHGFGFAHMLSDVYGKPHFGWHMHGMYLSVPNNLIENSRIHDNTGYGINLYAGDNDNTIVRDNLIYNNGAGMDGTSFGVHVGNGGNILVYGNEIYGNSGGISVSSTATDALVFDNVIHNNDRLPSAMYPGVSGGEADSLLLQDNVIYNQKAGSLAVSANSVAIDNTFTAVDDTHSAGGSAYDVNDVIDVSGLQSHANALQDIINDFVFKTENNANTTVFVDASNSGASHVATIATLQMAGLLIEDITHQANQAIAA